MARALGRRTSATTRGPRLNDRCDLRSKILDKEQLRRDVIRDDRMRLENPESWRRAEAWRRQRNREKKSLNDRLRALGLAQVPLLPSLAAQKRRLQRLQQENLAVIATFRHEVSENPLRKAGASLAFRRRHRFAEEGR